MQKLQRKGWRVDIKWVCAILATVSLMVSLTSFAFYRVAGSPELIKFQKNTLTSTLGLDTKLIGDSKGSSINPKTFKIKIGKKQYTPNQLDSMSETEFKQLMKEFDGGKSMKEFMLPTSPLGKGGSAGKAPNMESFGSMMQDPKALQNQMGSMAAQTMMPYVNNLFSDAAKGMFLTMFIFSLLGAILFSIPMIGVSYRSGRLMSLALVLFISALPVFLIATFLKTASSVTGAVAGGDPLSLVSILANANFVLFLVIEIVAVVLMVIASILGMIFAATSKSPKPAAQQVQQPPTPMPKAS